MERGLHFEECFLKLKTLEQGKLKTKEKATFKYLQGLYFKYLKKSEQSEELFKQSLALNELQSDCLLQIATLYYLQNSFRRATIHFYRAREVIKMYGSKKVLSIQAQC